MIQESSHDVDQNVSEFIAMNRVDIQELNQNFDEESVNHQNMLDDKPNCHKRYSTQHVIPSTLEGGPKDSIEKMSGLDAEDDSIRQSLKIFNIANGNCQALHVPLPSIMEPPMKTPEPKLK